MFRHSRGGALASKTRARGQGEKEKRGNGEGGTGEGKEAQGTQRRKRFAPETAMASKRIRLVAPNREREARPENEVRPSEPWMRSQNMNQNMNLNMNQNLNKNLNKNLNQNLNQNSVQDDILEVESSSDSDVEVVAVRRPGDIAVVDLASGSDSEVEEVPG